MEKDYKELYMKERNYTKIYIIALLALTIFMVLLAIKFSGTTVKVDCHIERVDIQDLRLIDCGTEDTIMIDFVTPDNNEYNLSYTEPDASVAILSKILNDWDDENKYTILHYDIITKYSYNIFTDNVDVDTEIVIKNTAVYLE